MFLNKYGEDSDLPTVANKLADMINTFELINKIQVDEENDFEVDDEIITEEEFRSKVEEDIKKRLHQSRKEATKTGKDIHTVDISDQLDIDELKQKFSTYSSTVQDDLLDHLDILISPNNHQSNLIANSAKNTVKESKRKMKKVSVAPGEMGEFKNWGKDIYLERENA